LPFDEFVDKVRAEMVRKGLHRAGTPLEPRIVEELRDLHTAAVRAYRVGGPEEVDRMLGGRRRNPYPDWEQRDEPIALARNVVNAMLKAGLVTDDGARVVEIMVRRLSLSESEALDIVNEASRGGAPASGRAIADVLRARTGTPESAEVTRQLTDYRLEHIADEFGPGGKYARKNPLDLATVLGAGILAGVASGVTQPYVTRHVYGEGALGAVANPTERFYVAPDDYPTAGPGSGWWSVYDSVTREKMNLQPGTFNWRHRSQAKAQRIADKLNRDWAAGKIRVIPDGETGRGAA
jgi:hypothetical protein